jgi:RND family efflux transporter MFP subunit
VVSEKQVSIGDIVQLGGALYTVVDPSSLELAASVPAEALTRLALGMPVQFVVTGYPGRRFTGRITRINPSADPATRQVRVYAELPNSENNLVSGLFAEGRVAAQSRLAVAVPNAAIDRRLGRPAVLKVLNGKVERVEVALGLADEQTDQVEIRSGVAAGDLLLVGAAQQITPGTPVRLSPPGTPAVPERQAELRP